MSAPRHLVTVSSPFGPFSLVWRLSLELPRVLRIFLSNEQEASDDLARVRFGDASRHTHPIIDDLVDQLQRFLRGQDVRSSLDLMALDTCSGFQQRVLRAEYDVPRGCTTTYGRIASHLGKQGGARAVGSALARNPFPLVIPCHRAIRSDGHIGGYQGGTAMKRALLEMEGIGISEAGIIRSSRAYY